MYRASLVRAIATIAATLGIGLAFAAPAAAQSDAPAGNNGHIKVDDVPIDDGSENVPHPGCTFVVDFFGYDVGTRTATLTFEGQDPTGGGQLMVDTWTFEVATRDTGNELNASRTVDLSDALVGIAPHPKQGWHVKLTVNVDEAQGADVKHKTFWVSDCTSEVLIASQAAVDLEYDTAVWAAAAQANAVAAADAAAVQAAAAAAAAAAAPADQLPRTGTTTGLLAGLAVALVAAGVLLVRASDRGASTS
ncbi:MAG TPA: hypothetical protein VFU93_07800 [Acidimicrobiales bacterium]|nr:hypothetical protein [Acidimicrobiales bacterium]